ncbi:helix-turn-helix domain-containing protein [Shouchella clausii]|uniref:helix-turn-helix domain-containing protein n=1 Tax=Shouchella clausii TaxID=79880 RepID=UPI001C737DBA|nr:helix-turn-helix transcriptional regulator [Shouchella clausii]MBX0320140.1 helix-turn-helix domain-containing protein [Shouchella clausii]
MLSKKLAELRKKQGLTQGEIAKKIGIPRTTFSGYENGNREPDYTTLKLFADFFEVSTDYLLGRTENPKSDISITVGVPCEDEEEKEFLEQQLEQYRKLKKRFLAQSKRNVDFK